MQIAHEAVSRTSGWSVPIWGSPSMTSRPAPQIHSLRSACASLSESTSILRAVFTNMAFFFILHKKSALTTCHVSSLPGTSTKSTLLPCTSWSSSTCWTEHRLCCAVRDSSSTVLHSKLGLDSLDVYMQCVRPKEMRPSETRKPAVQVLRTLRQKRAASVGCMVVINT
jgi:hypothetical protein